MSHTVIFLGTATFAVPSLEALARDSAFRVVLAVTQQDKPQGRGGMMTPPPIKVAATSLALPVFQPEDINEELPHFLHGKNLTPDFLIVVAYGSILKQLTLRLPRIMPINLHASLLPLWRGASPIQHALLAGDQETGVTTQKMIEEVDAGPILSQTSLPLSQTETYPILSQDLAHLGAELLVQTLKNPLSLTPQREEQATYCHRLSRLDGIVDPQTMSAIEIDRRVRAFTPWPGVSCPMPTHSLKILTTSLQPHSHALLLPCAQNTKLYLITVQTPGGKPMTGEEWARGHRAV